MALRGQSFALWSVLAGVLLLGCAGRGTDGPEPSGTAGNGGSGNGGAGGCGSGQMMCSSGCKDLSTDQQNCGTCGNACAAGQTCQGGQCLCSAGLLACGGSCVASDATHCGGCSTMCASGQVCANNACAASCPAGQAQCTDGACVPPTGGTALHCGGCNPCPDGSVCNGGVCGCPNAGQMLCSNACVDTKTSREHCGACGQACAGTCSNGVCTVIPGGTALLPPSVRRMTNAEYDASVQALLGTTQTPSKNFPPDARQHVGFTLNDAQRIDPVMAKALDDAALALVTEARTGNKLLVPTGCSNPSATQAENCAQMYIQEFGRKAFRRPLSGNEPADLLAVYKVGAASPGTYNEGIDLTTRAILQSVGFLYVTALGDGTAASPIKLSNEELAANLAFVVAGGPPDQTLIDMSWGAGSPPRMRARRRCAACWGCRPVAIAWCVSCASGWGSIASPRPRKTTPSTRGSRRRRARRWTPRRRSSSTRSW